MKRIGLGLAVILGNCRFVYRYKAKLVEVLTVYHGARLLDPTTLE